MAKIEEIYKPSESSFEEKDTCIEVYAVLCGRVQYINLSTNK